MPRSIYSWLLILGLVWPNALQGEPRKGDPAPDFTLQQLGGGQVSLSDFRGQVVLIDIFGYAWDFCIAEAAKIEKIWKEYKNRPFITIGVDVWDGSRRQVDFEFRRTTYVTFPLLMKASSLIRLYGLQQTNFVVVDHEGFIRFRSTGLSDLADVKGITAAIEEALSDLAVAQGQAAESTTDVTAREAQPDRFALEANYPNPFNAATTIRFVLAESGASSLRIYDIRGHQVRELLGHFAAAGAYAVSWDGRDEEGKNLASGIYLYRLQSGAQVSTRKMLLLR